MRQNLHLTLLGLVALVLSSCLPEERIWWSPKGDRAIVLVDDRLRLVNADGSLGGHVAGDASKEEASMKSVSWLPDGSGFVCQRVRMVPTWEEARKIIPAAEADVLDKMMPTVLPMLEAAVKLAPQSASPQDFASTLPLKNQQRFLIALQRAFKQDPATVEKLLVQLPESAELVSSLKGEGAGFEVNELCVFKLDAAGTADPKVLARSLLGPLAFPRVSPKHDAVAFLKADEDAENAALEVIALDGSSGLTVARNVSAAFDWMPDGRELVFMAPIGGEGEKLQSIHRISVVQENGKLMKPRHETQKDGSLLEVKGPDRLEQPVTLATVVTLNRPALQALVDGRVLFASSPMTLPLAGSGEELESRLFLIGGDGKSVQPVPTAPGDLPTNLGYFVASPDGKRVAVVEGETDAVAVVDVDTGRTQIISPPHARWQCRTIPAWKSATELTFAALHGEGGKPAWLSWSESAGTRSLSEKWPTDAVADWLEYKKPEPTNEPAVPKPEGKR